VAGLRRPARWDGFSALTPTNSFIGNRAVKRWEILATSRRGGKFYMEMSDGNHYHLAPVSERDAAYVQASLDAGNLLYATEMWE